MARRKAYVLDRVVGEKNEFLVWVRGDIAGVVRKVRGRWVAKRVLSSGRAAARSTWKTADTKEEAAEVLLK